MNLNHKCGCCSIHDRKTRRLGEFIWAARQTAMTVDTFPTLFFCGCRNTQLRSLLELILYLSLRASHSLTEMGFSRDFTPALKWSKTSCVNVCIHSLPQAGFAVTDLLTVFVCLNSSTSVEFRSHTHTHTHMKLGKLLTSLLSIQRIMWFLTEFVCMV